MMKHSEVIYATLSPPLWSVKTKGKSKVVATNLLFEQTEAFLIHLSRFTRSHLIVPVRGYELNISGHTLHHHQWLNKEPNPHEHFNISVFDEERPIFLNRFDEFQMDKAWNFESKLEFYNQALREKNADYILGKHQISPKDRQFFFCPQRYSRCKGKNGKCSHYYHYIETLPPSHWRTEPRG